MPQHGRLAHRDMQVARLERRHGFQKLFHQYVAGASHVPHSQRLPIIYFALVNYLNAQRMTGNR